MAIACYTVAMFGKPYRRHSHHTFVFLGTTLLVFLIGMTLAPELLPVLAPACMATLAASYALLAWMERDERH